MTSYFGREVLLYLQATLKNRTETIYFKEYDENIDITSVVIPINSRFQKYKNLDIQDQNLDIGDIELKLILLIV